MRSLTRGVLYTLLPRNRVARLFALLGLIGLLLLIPSTVFASNIDHDVPAGLFCPENEKFLNYLDNDIQNINGLNSAIQNFDMTGVESIAVLGLNDSTRPTVEGIHLSATVTNNHNLRYRSGIPRYDVGWSSEQNGFAIYRYNLETEEFDITDYLFDPDPPSTVGGNHAGYTYCLYYLDQYDLMPLSDPFEYEFNQFYTPPPPPTPLTNEFFEKKLIQFTALWLATFVGYQSVRLFVFRRDK